MSHPSLAYVDHRPWPIPTGRWTWRQSWLDLLFAHWPVDRDALRALVPPALELDTFDGEAWLGFVPFRMEGVMLRPLPDLPGVSAFPELNLRTYVRFEDKPGVYFFSLDAATRLAVWAARTFFHLPYFHARFELVRRGETLAYRCDRTDARSEVTRFDADYRPVSAPRAPRAGLEHFLTERYCLYADAGQGRIFRAEVHHPPWPLSDAELELRANTVHAPTGLALADTAPFLHFAARLDVVVWSPVRVV